MYKFKLKSPFKKILVISLKRSQNRRDWIAREIKRKLKHKFEFIDAVDSDDPKVNKGYQNGEVKTFPPCFRCGKIVCNCENNVLIETQVATFYSHKKAWEIIAASENGLYLIMEDDVKFNWYFTFLKFFYYSSINHLFQLNRKKPFLIRLAWALNEEHCFQRVRVKKNCVRMSNPCYAINPNMALKLIENFQLIDTTVDLYVHKHVGAKCDAYTLFPPMAHDLSYSKGQVESLIRPRKKRMERLINNNSEQAQAELQTYEHYPDSINYSFLLILGMPGENIYRMQELFERLDISVGCDKFKRDGIISWAFVVSDLTHPFDLHGYERSRYFSHFKKTIILIEDPRTSISDIINEIDKNQSSFKYITKHVKRIFDVDISNYRDKINCAALIYIYWLKIISKNFNKDIVLKQEQDFSSLRSRLVKLDILPTEIQEINKPHVHIKTDHVQAKTVISSLDLMRLSMPIRKQLNQICIEYGYNQVFNSSLTSVLN